MQKQIIATRTIEVLREQIDQIDEQLLALLAKRTQLAKKIGKEKKISRKPISDLAREEQILIRLTEMGRKLGLSEKIIRECWQLFFAQARKIQEVK